MPMVSLVVPVYSVQGYLRECLDSIVTQSYQDFELIAVDDCSPDHCGEILDEYAARDARVRVIHLDSNVGLGRARNVGLTQASGEYVWFVDSDDWIPRGALRAIATKLRQTVPDVLMIDHTTVSWTGRAGASRGVNVLDQGDTGDCFRLVDRPEVLWVLHTAWNKVVRREFMLGAGIKFYPGWYEDVPFTYPLLLAADRIATLGRVCYHYRRRRQGAITRTEDERHFEVFEQYQRLFDHLDRMGGRAAPLRGPLFERMLWHYLAVQAREERVPKGAHRAFFGRLSEHYRRYLPADHPAPPSRLDRLRRRLIAADAYRTFRTLRLARLAMARARKVVRLTTTTASRTARWATTQVKLKVKRMYYRLQCRLPLDRRLAVYAAYWYQGYSCNPAAIYAKARELAPSVRGVWVVKGSRRGDMPAGVPYVVEGSLGYYRALARAGWLVNNVNFPDFVVKRRGSIHVQTHHGTPVKVMGVEQGAYPVGADGMDLHALLRRCDRWDYSISANAHTTEVWERAYPCPYQTLEYGYPRNDRLALANPDDTAAARAALGIDPHHTVVLYAPTHRDYLDGFQPLLDIEELADTLGPNHVLLQRAHYFYTATGAPTHPTIRDVSTHPCVEDVLLATDILITDYSSIMFDYAVLDRPIVLYTPDWDTYQRTRGVTFDLLAEPPGIVATTQADLADAFRTGAITGGATIKLRSQFRARYTYLDDGHAAERVVRHILGDALRA
jgi:CDP-glycerol glycerophosphotransferase